jgi:uncharacterized protein (TIGR00251 family)
MYLHLKVKTEAKRDEVNKLSDDHYEISVREPAERNLANKRIIELLSELFPNRQVRIINGHHSPSKLVSVEDES